MTAFDPDATEIFLDDGDNFVASYKNVVVQVRRGSMTLAGVEQVASILRLARARGRRQDGALIAVLEDSAELSTGAVRARQMALIRELLAHDRSWAATVVAEGTAKAALLRTFMRLLALGQTHAAVFGTALDAGRWLEKRVNLPATELAALVSWGRHVAKKKDG
ncbi:hypothetical protein BH11MYX4_BH11MYX4_02620 [soil metagenome]